jgi:hypothetical protein
MTTVNIKLDRKKKYRNAFYMMSIERAIMATLVIGDYFNMRILDDEIEIVSDNEVLIGMLYGLLKEVEDEND